MYLSKFNLRQKRRSKFLVPRPCAQRTFQLSSCTPRTFNVLSRTLQRLHELCKITFTILTYQNLWFKKNKLIAFLCRYPLKLYLKQNHLSFYYQEYNIICFRFCQGKKKFKTITFYKHYLKFIILPFLSLDKIKKEHLFKPKQLKRFYCWLF